LWITPSGAAVVGKEEEEEEEMAGVEEAMREIFAGEGPSEGPAPAPAEEDILFTNRPEFLKTDFEGGFYILVDDL
jgi:hypothetical protein